ncbi:hypothetical protein RND81_14G209500 [Saponaria officinalis]|uniref:Uncharacterized protein n=1 Tax=Saponaria officinalis TaxID=3572 RepID=A0AAW1GRZ1_SAPOF
MSFNFDTKCSILSLVISLLLLVNSTLGVRQLSQTSTEQPMTFTYHHGPLLSGQFSINLIWYGKFKPTQRAVITDFFTSVSSTRPESNPSVAMWWNSISKYYRLTNRKGATSALSLSKLVVYETYYLGKFLTTHQIEVLASKGTQQTNAINIVLTSADVGVDGFCMSRCGTHRSIPAPKSSKTKTTYIWVGNSETQCPGQCAWPFHQPIYGPQGLPLVAPNNDVGIDGIWS